MATEAASVEPRSAAAGGISRGIYVLMALVFMGVALAGFVPRTVATLAGEMAVRPPIIHVHAVLMGSWLVLFLAQASLMATQRRALHQKLGLVSLALAPAIAVVMLVIIAGGLGGLVAQVNDPAVELSSAEIGRRAAFSLFVQGRAVLLFAVFYAWAVLARRGAPGTHKRLMVLATFVVIDAALGRMAWLPGHPGNWVASDAGYDMLHLYHLLLIAPAVACDIVTRRSVHHAYVVGLGLFLVFAAVTHVLWNAAWWHSAVAALARAGG